MKKLFLLDGHALIFKMYYAFLGRPMVNSRGVDTSILFGFTKYLLELIEREQPQYVAVSFDPPGGCFRNDLYPAYKANRQQTPQLVIDALDPLTRILQTMRIPVLMLSGFEADDVIGSAAKRFAAEGLDVYMVTPDKDYGQLIAEHIWQYRPGKAGGDNEIIGPCELCEKWKIQRPEQVIDLLAICGDVADNVPGVQGVGPVGAAKLLGKFGSLAGIYEHIGELTARQQALFEAARDHIWLSRELVTIKCDIPLDISKEDMLLRIGGNAELEKLFKELEFPSLLRMVRKLAPNSVAPLGWSAPASVQNEDAQGENAQKYEFRAVALKPKAFAALGSKRLALCYKDGRLWLCDGKYCSNAAVEEFKALLQDERVVKLGLGLKAQIKQLAACGVELSGRLEDIELMHYLLNPERGHKLELLAQSYLGVDLESGEAVAQTASLFDDGPAADGPEHSKEAEVLLPLADILMKEMEEKGVKELYDKLEEPLLWVLARMERTGVKIDQSSLQDYARSLREGMLEQEAVVRRIAGDPALNVASPRQIGSLIFEKLQLDPKARKPRTGNWPTDETTLSELADKSPVIDAILEYRGLRKLLSTYIEPIPGYVSPRDGRVHTTFNQALTATGRLSSSNPNLQNIPVRTDKGRVLRQAFVAGSADSVMMSADYSQIELRIMAHLSGDVHLIEAFRAGLDVHSATAAKIFGVGIDEVTSEQRRIAKTANFGIMYGISAFGLAQRLKCSRSEAKQIIEDYFASFPSIRGFIDSTIASARENGYVETLFGRRRYISDIGSHNVTVRSLAERNAVNAPIQGTAADIIKFAMIEVDRRLREQGLAAKMVLQIHDELLLEVPSSEVGIVETLLKESMENVISLSIPLTVECNYGKTWLDAH